MEQVDDFLGIQVLKTTPIKLLKPKAVHCYFNYLIIQFSYGNWMLGTVFLSSLSGSKQGWGRHRLFRLMLEIGKILILVRVQHMWKHAWTSQQDPKRMWHACICMFLCGRIHAYSSAQVSHGVTLCYVRLVTFNYINILPSILSDNKSTTCLSCIKNFLPIQFHLVSNSYLVHF